jgi:hypothetical protein
LNRSSALRSSGSTADMTAMRSSEHDIIQKNRYSPTSWLLPLSQSTEKVQSGIIVSAKADLFQSVSDFAEAIHFFRESGDLGRQACASEYDHFHRVRLPAASTIIQFIQCLYLEYNRTIRRRYLDEEGFWPWPLDWEATNYPGHEGCADQETATTIDCKSWLSKKRRGVVRLRVIPLEDLMDSLVLGEFDAYVEL